MTLADLPLTFYRVYGALFGLVWGSFLNVVIYRLPRGMSVASPPSHCPACRAKIRPYDNLPVISYLLLRGRTRCCKQRYSPRYLFVELVCGMLGWAIVEALLLRLDGSTSLLRAAAIFVANLALCLGLVAASFIDLEHMYIPDSISLGGTVLGIATASLRVPLTIVEAAIGALFGFLLVWLPFGVGYRLLRGRTGMGLGDAKLVMLAGGWFGYRGALFALMAGAVQGSIAAGILLMTQGTIHEPDGVRKERETIRLELDQLSGDERARMEAELAKDPLFEETAEGRGGLRMAFGPFIALATLEYLFFGEQLAEKYVAWAFS